MSTDSFLSSAATLLDSTTDITELVHEESSAPTPILFAFASCACGALIRTCLKQVPIRIPYTVIVLVLGTIVGVMAKNISAMTPFTTIADMNPHTILHAFLPVLIFESAFAMEAHMFVKSLIQILVLAVPGLAFSTALTAVFSKYTFDYQWSWTICLMFGAIISATDPVSVVALLKELGVSKHLTVLVEGESLVNDGAAIVLFEVFQHLSIPDNTMTGETIAVTLCMKVVVGPVFGFIMAKITVFWLVNVFNDALTEITITLASTYITFYLGEELQVSGVVSVVVLGVTLSAERTSISPEVETFLQRFWEMLAYLANTLIFILVGVVIMKKAIHSVEGKDWVYCISLFVAVTFIRALMIIMLSPVLMRTGYGMPWRNATVLIWGGLRGAVGLAMALMVSHKSQLDLTGNVQNQILFHSAGIVMLSLLLNATSISVLLKLLGMTEESVPKRITMATAFRNLCDVKNTGMALYQTDRFLADADWDVVKKYTELNNPYETLDEEDLMDLGGVSRHSKCPNCDSRVPCQPTKKETDAMREEARLRLLKAQRISYWKQFEHGMLSREAVRRLVEYVDAAVDEDGSLIKIEDIEKSWDITGIYPFLKRKLELWNKKKPTKKVIQAPENGMLNGFYKVAVHRLFDWFLYLVIFLNVVAICVEMSLLSKAECRRDYYRQYHNTFMIINYVFIVIYTLEAFIKILGMRKAYFKSVWNMFDFAILLLSFMDTILDVTVFKPGDIKDGDDCEDQNVGFSPAILRVAKAVRFLRLLRSLRLIKGLIPQLITVVNKQINKKLRFGYDVGKGYITAEEEAQQLVDYMVEDKNIAKELKERVEGGRVQIIKGLGRLQKQNPGIAVSVKSQQASRRILNTLRDKVIELRGEGVLDIMESHKLELMIEIRMKKLLKIPSTIQPPPPEKIIGNLSWCMNDPVLTEYIKHNAVLVSLPEGEKVNAEAEPEGGIYVVISGLVKVVKLVAMVPSRREQNVRKQSFFPTIVNSTTEVNIKTRSNVGRVETVVDYLTTGSLLGEMALLTKRPEHDIDITCDTSVQTYYISYDAIQAALELFTDEPCLEFRLWRVCAIRITAGILKHIPFYRGWAQERIKLHLENASMVLKHHVIPEGTDFLNTKHEVFNTSFESMQDVLLIHGEAQDEFGDTFVGPCLIPQRVDYILLMQGPTDSHVIVVAPRDSSYMLDLSRRKSIDYHGGQPLVSGSEANVYPDHLMDDGLRRRSSTQVVKSSDRVAPAPSQDSMEEMETQATGSKKGGRTVAFNIEHEIPQPKSQPQSRESGVDSKMLALEVDTGDRRDITVVEEPAYRPSSTENV